MRFWHQNNRSLACKAKEGRHVRIMYLWKTIRTRFYFQPVLTYWNMLNDHKEIIKWKAKKTTIGTIPKSNIKIVERGKFDTTNTQIHDRSLFWIGTVYGPKPPYLIIFFHLLMFYICFVFPTASRICSIIWIVTDKLSLIGS